MSVSFRRICALGLFVACALPRAARSEEAPEPEPRLGPVAPLGVDVALSFVLAQPFEGARSFGDWGYGLMLLGGLRWKDLPLSVGCDLQAIRWGRASSLIGVQLGDSQATLEQSRLDQTIIFDSWIRLQPPRWRMKPYLEGFVGLKMLDTKYSLSFVDGTGTTSTVTDHANASNYGFGIGLDVLLAQASDASGSALSLTLGLRELYGSRASFTRAPDESSVNQTVSFDLPTRSTVIMLGFLLQARHRQKP